MRSSPGIRLPSQANPGSSLWAPSASADWRRRPCSGGMEGRYSCQRSACSTVWRPEMNRARLRNTDQSPSLSIPTAELHLTRKYRPLMGCDGGTSPGGRRSAKGWPGCTRLSICPTIAGGSARTSSFTGEWAFAYFCAGWSFLFIFLLRGVSCYRRRSLQVWFEWPIFLGCMLPGSLPSRKWTPLDERPWFDHRQCYNEEESSDCKDSQDTPQDRKRFCRLRSCEQECHSKGASIGWQGRSKQLKGPAGHRLGGHCQVPGSLPGLWYNRFSFGLEQAE